MVHSDCTSMVTQGGAAISGDAVPLQPGQGYIIEMCSGGGAHNFGYALPLHAIALRLPALHTAAGN